MRIDDSTEAQNTETWKWESNIRMNATETRYLLVDDHLYCNREDHNRCHKGFKTITWVFLREGTGRHSASSEESAYSEENGFIMH